MTVDVSLSVDDDVKTTCTARVALPVDRVGRPVVTAGRPVAAGAAGVTNRGCGGVVLIDMKGMRRA